MIRGIYNQNEFYSDHYLDEILVTDLKDLNASEINLATLRNDWLKSTDLYRKSRNTRSRISSARPFLTSLFGTLGYDTQIEPWTSEDSNSDLPLLASFRRTGDHSDSVLVFSLYPELESENSLLGTRMTEEQYEDSPRDIPVDKRQTALTVEDLISKVIFMDSNPPRWILLTSIEEIILIDRSKWGEKRTLRLSLKDLYNYKQADGYRAFANLLNRESLVPGEGESLLDRLDENSHKHAHAVSEDLKFSLREAVELIGNEAVHQIGASVLLEIPEGESQLSRECLRYMYRLLFLLYIEARPELEYAPINDATYLKGYSLESLRDIADGPEPDTEDERNGKYLHDSVQMLFRLVNEGYGLSKEVNNIHQNSFVMDPLKTHLFDPSQTAMLEKVVFPNHVLHRVIQLMSLSRAKTGKKNRRGRISYFQLGINQLGAVYEGLLSYRGFIAREELFEVKRADDKDERSPLKPAVFVGRDALSEYKEAERVKDKNGNFISFPAGSFLYRLTGRDREKSASYYTPEVLTQCLVKYSLKELLDGKTADEILALTVCEPAMGSAAFLNEAVNQLAEEYLRRKQKETKITIAHQDYAGEKQKVKALIVDRNVFGVDLNPVAVELGEVSLWLNTIIPGGFVPWFGLQLKNGNSLIGARRETLPYSSLEKGATKPWYQVVPDRVDQWNSALSTTTAKIYHFLLPDPGMAEYKDKVIKSLVPEALEVVSIWKKKILQPFGPQEVESLRLLTSAADKLWLAWARHLADLRRSTTDTLNVFGQSESGIQTDLAFKDTIVKSEVQSEGIKASSEYRRLRLVMDYWCALWFWPLDQVHLPPSRDEWLNELSLLLSHGKVKVSSDTQDMFSRTLSDDRRREYQDELGIVNVEALIADSPRLQMVEIIAKAQKFFHWELEYTDIFAARGGFDLILGNPPWIKVEWQEGGLLSEYQPLFAIRNLSASKQADLRAGILEKFPKLLEEYCREYEESSATQNFLNALVNYPLLKKTRSNLYKNFLPLSWHLASTGGVQGFLHPEGVYDDPKGGALRKNIYPRLRYHFQFQNELKLFEIANRAKFSLNVYLNNSLGQIALDSISNLFVPATIDLSYQNNGDEDVPGIKDDDDNWNFSGHKKRIISIGEKELSLFARLYDSIGTPASEARLPAIHSLDLISVLEKFAVYPHRIGDIKESFVSLEMWNETNAQKDGTIRRETVFPESPNQWIVSGPHFYVGNPTYQTPRENCNTHRAYDILDLITLPGECLPRSNYVPACSPEEYERRTLCVPWEVNGKKRKVTEYYRFINRSMLSQAGERTLVAGIIPKDVGHIHTVISTCFKKNSQLLDLTASLISIVFDFYVKTTGRGFWSGSYYASLPAISNPQSRVRTLCLTALTTHYRELWNEMFPDKANDEIWFKSDPRLSNDFFRRLTSEWNRNCALRTDYERRQALVEIDVLVARELQLTLDELLAIYRIQFPVLRQNENDTWYDRNGRIIFTCSKGLTGVGLPRKKKTSDAADEIFYSLFHKGREEKGILLGWEDVKDFEDGDWVSKTWIDDTLPGGPRQKTVVYKAPFDCCSREADYREAWGNLDSEEKPCSH